MTLEKKKNCWEFIECGREPAGKKIKQLGVCPVTIAEEFDGLNHGQAAGRICWTIEGSLSTGTTGMKLLKCLECSFFEEVQRQEGRFFVLGIGDAPQSKY